MSDMGNIELQDPLGAVEVANRLLTQARGWNLDVRLSADFHEFARLRQELRGKVISPMFDPQVSGLDATSGFWMGTWDGEGRCVALNAFRLDHVEPNLAQWALGWMVGLYIRRGELILPSHITPPAATRAEQVRGRVAYHGEAWIDPKNLRVRDAVEVLPLLGMLLAFIKWSPDAIWAVCSEAMAKRGVATRFGYTHLERSFLSWEWLPEGADAVEWLALMERRDLEFLIQERLTQMRREGADQMMNMSTGASSATTETPLIPFGKRTGSTTR